MRTSKYRDWDDIGEGIINVSLTLSFVIGLIELCLCNFLQFAIVVVIGGICAYIGYRINITGLLWGSWNWNTPEFVPLLTYDEIEKFVDLGVLYWDIGMTISGVAAIRYVGIVKDDWLGKEINADNYCGRCTRVGIVFEDYEKVHKLLSKMDERAKNLKTSSIIKKKQEEIEKTLDALKERIRDDNDR